MVKQVIVNNILEFIGNTPMVRVNHLNPNPKLEMFLKLEKFNPGGSVKDPEVIAAADAAGIAMVFAGKRHFKH